MNYQRPELADRLAAEFVLGTLRGPARQRFERLIHSEPVIAAAVQEWEERLLPLAEQLPPVTPPARLWPAILARISLKPASSAVRPAKRALIRNAWWDRIAFWRRLAIASFAGLLILTQVHIQKHDELFPETYIAILSDQAAKPVIIVSAKRVGHYMTVKNIMPQALRPDQTLELWALPVSGLPRSLGLIPTAGVARLPLHGEASDFFGGVSKMAVSLEPRGGSPTGSPTGPVLYQGPVLETS